MNGFKNDNLAGKEPEQRLYKPLNFVTKTYVFIEKHIKQRYLAVEVMGTQTKYSRYLEILRRLIQQVEG